MTHTLVQIIFRTAAITAALGVTSTVAANKANAQKDVSSTSAIAVMETERGARFLPDAPSTSAAREDDATATAALREGKPLRFVKVRLISAPKYASVIEPEYQQEGLVGLSQAAYGSRELFSDRFPVVVLISAGISHGANSDPLYGKGRNAFVQRVGAAGARQASQIVFSDVLMAPLLHEDPRYYVMGSNHSMCKRVGYAATRVLFTRTASGKTTPNLALLAGYGGSAALTQLYYPVRSRDTTTVLFGYGLSLGGRAIGYELAEFCRFFGAKQPRQVYDTFR